MSKNIKKHIKPRMPRLGRLSESFRAEISAARHERHWSQAYLGKLVGLPQMHISGIETGKITPRLDTFLDLIRALDRDLVIVPRALLPVVQALVKDSQSPNQTSDRGLYADERET